MPHVFTIYRAYLVDHRDDIFQIRHLICRDDEEAIDEALSLVGQYSVELWHRDRKIMSFAAPQNDDVSFPAKVSSE